MLFLVKKNVRPPLCPEVRNCFSNSLKMCKNKLVTNNVLIQTKYRFYEYSLTLK